MNEWQNTLWLFPHEPMRYMFTAFEWALKVADASSLEVAVALERLWEVIGIWIIAHHEGEDQVMGKHFPDIFGSGTTTHSQHKDYHSKCSEIKEMLIELKRAAAAQDHVSSSERLSDVSKVFTPMMSDLFEHLAQEETKFPNMLKSKGWTWEYWQSWSQKDLLPHEMKSAKESRFVETGNFGVEKRMGAVIFLLINCAAVWASQDQIDDLLKAMPPFFVLNAFKQCFEYRWVMPLKIIRAHERGDP